eukprot:PLAT7395.1.p2 GENE.PLAT7395.1~~PLAT7395.1.p2  ORF type:complete len:227 (+),score=34.74 PLAT7395.1:3-683(+)
MSLAGSHRSTCVFGAERRADSQHQFATALRSFPQLVLAGAVMTKYSITPEDPTKAVKTSGSRLRVHFRNTRETAAAIRGLSLPAAEKYLIAVMEHRRAVPFRVHTGGVGRAAQGKNEKAPGSKVRWPKKSAKFLLDLVKNAAANAEARDIEPENLVITHIQVNRAPKQRRRTYRAHGRIGPYMASPCHIELVLTEKDSAVPRPKERAPRKLHRHEVARRRRALKMA